ncbi:MAG: hypothetical protein FWF00_05820 [Endomicrobia bacterium]|nr:hypothetical protein [Endomicrobiia bacterium]MCL2507184.1 hypothetical protein [Endomicrobiia bacterium]
MNNFLKEERVIETCSIKFLVEDVVKICSEYCRWCSVDCRYRKEKEE